MLLMWGCGDYFNIDLNKGNVDTDPNKSCPDEYLYVSGNSTFETTKFCVMKYEAKEDGITHLPVSRPDQLPWFDITITDAHVACQSLGDGYDLISNKEWMTIAYEIEQNPLNWTSGTVGVELLYSGNNDKPWDAGRVGILDVQDTSDPYDQTGYDENSPTPVIAGDPNGKEQRRTLYLASGETIWDFSGNVWEWVNWNYGDATLGGIDNTQKAYDSDDAGPVTDWRNLNLLDSNVSSSDDMYEQLFKPANTSWSYTKGIGQYLAGMSRFGGYAMRGGSYYAGWTVNGIYSLAVDLGSAQVSHSEGFRCVKRLE